MLCIPLALCLLDTDTPQLSKELMFPNTPFDEGGSVQGKLKAGGLIWNFKRIS